MMDRHQQASGSWPWSGAGIILLVASAVTIASIALGYHKEGTEEPSAVPHTTGEASMGHAIPGASFHIFLHEEQRPGREGGRGQSRDKAALQTVMEAFSRMMKHPENFPRFQEALAKDALHHVLIEPNVVNREGKEFLFLVARTTHPNQVNLLISASALQEQGYLHSSAATGAGARPENSNGL